LNYLVNGHLEPNIVFVVAEFVITEFYCIKMFISHGDTAAILSKSVADSDKSKSKISTETPEESTIVFVKKGDAVQTRRSQTTLQMSWSQESPKR